MTNKPRLIKDYEKLSPEILAEIKAKYPYSFEKHLIKFTNAKGEIVSALPYEGEQYYYLIRMTKKEALQIEAEDEDFGDDIDEEIEVSDDDMEYDDSTE